MFEQYRLTKDVGLRNDIVLRYMDIVRYVAVSTRGIYCKYAEVDDIVNEGVLALIKAVETYDIERGVKFETYAAIRVKGAIIDFVRKQDWIPRRVRHFGHTLEAAYNELYTKLDRHPTNQELADHLEMPKEKMLRAMADLAGAATLSFEELLYEDNFEDAEQGGLAADQEMYEKELKEVLTAAINELKPREKQVISLYYYERLKFGDIAKVLGVSESRVCQIHSKAMLLLKRKLQDYVN
ncbi:MAG: FliA/WhiG family RNA polymerase sigma factor [Ruminococcaceae bacterium]|nr:FliA/WhiG family RNA polymerase sigma factor [Oscillospiraceae bacterium]